MVLGLTPRKFIIIAIVFAALACSGCLETQLKQPELSSGELRLLKANHRPMRLNLNFKEIGETLGHQYLFVIIPFGSISLENPKQYLEALTLRALGLKGLQPVTDVSAPMLQLSVSELSATGYDLFFVRRVACSLEIQATYLSASGEPKRSTVAFGEYNSYVKFAFAPELTTCIEKAFENASEKLWAELWL